MLLRHDELNALKGDIARYKGNLKKLLDLAEDWLLLAYADGKTDAEEQLGRDIETPIEDIYYIIYADVGGKTIADRTKEYFHLEDYEALYSTLQNERQRVYNEAAFDTALKAGAKSKTWRTMEDALVRDTHDYIDRMTKPINEPFYTYDGDSAMYPMAFENPSNNINCRCYLTFT